MCKRPINPEIDGSLRLQIDANDVTYSLMSDKANMRYVKETDYIISDHTRHNPYIAYIHRESNLTIYQHLPFAFL